MLKKSILMTVVASSLVAFTFAQDASSSSVVSTGSSSISSTGTVMTGALSVSLTSTGSSVSSTVESSSSVTSDMITSTPCTGAECGVGAETAGLESSSVDSTSTGMLGTEQPTLGTEGLNNVSSESADANMVATGTGSMDNVGNIKVGPQTNMIVIGLVMMVSVLVLYKLKKTTK